MIFANGARRMMLKQKSGFMTSSTLMKRTCIAMNGNQMDQRGFATLILAEHFEGKLNGQIGSCLKAA